MKVKLYIEGGGDSDSQRAQVRKAFSELFRKVLAGRMPQIIACGGRDAAFKKFKTALNESADAFCILLVDSEAPVTMSIAWDHLKARDAWDRPGGATDDQVQLMVQCMEAWLLADRGCLARYYGNGFSAAALPNRPIEEVPKRDLFEALEKATSSCKTKQPYSKGRHSWDLLARLDPALVRSASPHAERLFRALINVDNISVVHGD